MHEDFMKTPVDDLSCPERLQMLGVAIVVGIWVVVDSVEVLNVVGCKVVEVEVVVDKEVIPDEIELAVSLVVIKVEVVIVVFATKSSWISSTLAIEAFNRAS